MKNTLLTLLTAVSLVSCASGPNAQTGSVLGALGGAAVGGIIGSQSHRGLEGAAIGAGLGALGGNALGNARDQRNYQQGYGQPGYGRQPQQRGYYDNNGRYHYY
ncbi:glycine zipper domain-containing protein [Prosthecobacter sp.]|uniref:glycine zipper domain-containing protein n=1 Tax=Prosthecobacter sp. TaxID=1965333 RepID=UPI003784B870